MTNKTPEIRFNNFYGDWEQRKLNKLATFSKGRGYSKGDLINEGNPIILYGRLYTKYETVIEEVNTYAKIIENSTISRGGEVIVPASGETSQDISRASVVAKSGIIIGGDLNIINTKKEIDSVFLALTISNGTQQKELTRRAQGKSVVHIRNSDLKDVDLQYPKKDEQFTIGVFFKQLDKTIALHQREMELLKKMKKGFLQKMFTKNEEKAPEVRFAYFVKDWEQRKLKDLATFSKGKGYSKSDLRDEGNPIILYGRLYTKYETVIEEVNTYVKKIENSTISLGNEVIVPASGETSEDISRASVVAKSGIIIGGDLNIINTTEDINSIFLALTISNRTQQKELTRRAQGKSVVHIRNSDLKNVNLQYPIKEEQLKIGMFFNQIDKSIVLHQNKIEKLKVMKKAFLQKMFV